MMFTEKQILKSILLDFSYDYYDNQIKRIRKEIEEEAYYKNNLDLVIELIINKKLENDEALNMVHNIANVALHDNTEEEAYRWLTLLIINITKQGSIIQYNPNNIHK